MYDPIQHLPFLLIVEHDRPEFRAVEVPVLEEDVSAEDLDDAFEGGGAWLYDLAGEEVGVDDGDAVGREKGGDGGFACGYPTGETYD